MGTYQQAGQPLSPAGIVAEILHRQHRDGLFEVNAAIREISRVKTARATKSVIASDLASGRLELAKIFTEPEFVTSKPSLRQPLRIVRSQPIEITMTQEEAIHIQPGTWLTFTGELKFHPQKYGAVGRSTESQQMYDLRHEYLGGGYLGTFTTTKFECTIDGEKANCRWEKP